MQVAASAVSSVAISWLPRCCWGDLACSRGGDGSSKLLRFDADESRSAAKRDLVADEVQAGGSGGLLDASDERLAALVEDTEVPDKARDGHLR